MQTQDADVYASPVHLEAPWYDSGGQLTIRPDITILDPRELSILHRSGRYGAGIPSKQFEFAGSAAIVELKFVRSKAGVTSCSLAAIERDYDKIHQNLIKIETFRPLRESVFCFFVVANKTDIRCPEFNEYMLNRQDCEWCKYIYLSGHVTF